MDGEKRIQSALLSVFHKDGLEPIVRELERTGVQLYSTGGTQEFIEKLGVKVIPVEDLTTYPSILGGRVKTLHPKVFGGILGRRDLESDVAQLEEYEIPPIDLVIVDLYPFEATVAAGGSPEAIIEKIDIGGIALIRAAAKNHKDVVIIAAQDKYSDLLGILKDQQGHTSLEQRRSLAAAAFAISSNYDSAIHNWFAGDDAELRLSIGPKTPLRYGENPHQKAAFHGDLYGLFRQLNGKELSYNNLLDLDAAVKLIEDLGRIAASNDGVAFAILKHNNACGAAIKPTLKEAWDAALAGDPVSAFGGVLITTASIDKSTAEAIDTIFFEIIAAPGYDADALDLLKKKKNRVILERASSTTKELTYEVRSALNGVLVQAKDAATENEAAMNVVTTKTPAPNELKDLVFANILVKHTKSNAIVLAKNDQLIASGTGQTSRVDALEQAIAKAEKFKFALEGAVMASDAFFPFPDCVEIAHKAGITAVVQPGGSIRDKDSIDYCNNNGMAMCLTGNRHFKH